MSRRIHVFDRPDRFVADAIGVPGQRTFYLQARDGQRVVSVILEKVQVAAMAERLVQLLSAVSERGVELPPDLRTVDDAAPLDEPLRESFRVGTIVLGWDDRRRRVMVEARAQVEEDEEQDEEPVEVPDDAAEGYDLLRVFVEPPAVHAFARRATRVVAGGRPPCPMCGQPLDPQGHLCPRRNGYVH
ncbi:MAG: DUF3090 family protein [Candidatus Limnocylindrales bacterium]